MKWLSFRKPKVSLCALHIDDSAWIRMPVSVILRRHFKMRVLEASSGAEGVELARREQPDVIILDVMMPQMDGFETLTRLKQDKLTQNIPVLMCTARDLTREVSMAVRLGAQGYLTKPIEEERLLSKVEEILKSLGKWGGATQPSPKPHPNSFDQRVERVLSDPPPPTGEPVSKPGRPCPHCQADLSFIKDYDAWYCYPCRKYPDVKFAS